ncbi:hypothetical protein [[Eubacterium] cellulosolvens]
MKKRIFQQHNPLFNINTPILIMVTIGISIFVIMTNGFLLAFTSQDLNHPPDDGSDGEFNIESSSEVESEADSAVGSSVNFVVGSSVDFVVGSSVDLEYTKRPVEFINSRSRQVNNSPPYFLKQEIPEVVLNEDFGSHVLNFSGYADDNEDSAEELHWFITNYNKSLIIVTNENSSDQKIILKSVSNAFGEDTVKLWVADTTGLMVYQMFDIIINPKNDFPIISGLPVLMVHRDKPYSIDLRPYLVDLDTPVSEIEIKVLPEDRDREFASINNQVLALNFKSTTDFTKNYITLELSDKINKSFAKVIINPTDNSPPELIKNIPDIILYTGEKLINILDLDYFFDDKDNEPETLTYEYLKAEHLTITINDDNTVDIAQNDNWLGMTQVIFRCIDPAGAFKEQLVNINILTRLPVVNLEVLPDLMVHYNQVYMFNLSPYIKMENIISETNLELFEFHGDGWVKSSELSNIMFDNSNNHIMMINFSKEYTNKTIPLSIHVTAGDASDTQEFLISVSDNYPPKIKRSLPQFTIDEDLMNSSALDLYEYFTDMESGNLEFSSSGKNVVLNIQVNGLVDISSTQDWFGEELVVVRATDEEGAIAEDAFLVKVNPINDPPKILPIPDINYTLGEVKTFEYLSYLSDVDNDVSELSVEVDNEHLKVAGWFLILDLPGDTGEKQWFTLSVSDGDLTSHQVINITVSTENVSGEDESNLISPVVFWGFTGILVVMFLILFIMGALYVKRLKSFRFNEIFLIYKDGLLIAHALRSKKSSQDTDIFSGMFTAVQDFIHDSFHDSNRTPESWPLKRLDFGNFKIVIDRGEYVYIAAVFEGFPVRRMLSKLEKLTKDIERKYVDVLPTWSGDMAQLKGTQKMLEKLLYITGGPGEVGVKQQEEGDEEVDFIEYDLTKSGTDHELETEEYTGAEADKEPSIKNKDRNRKTRKLR